MKRSYREHEAIESAFRTFEDLEVYRKARQFRKAMYGVTRKLPEFEKYELSSQIRRASVSLTNNIAEGHGRYHYLEQLKFLFQARGSLQKLIDDLNVCDDEQYLPKSELVVLKEHAREVQRLIAGTLAICEIASSVYLQGLAKLPTKNRFSATWPYFLTIQLFNVSTN